MREYSGASISLADVSQVLWAAHGVTHAGRRRTVPSAGALYPLQVYLLAGVVEGLETGLYRYRHATHELEGLRSADLRPQLAEAALGQDWMVEAAAVIVIVGAVRRTAVKYGGRATRYVHMEVGAAAQDVYLQATALGLGTVFVGAFGDHAIEQVLDLPEGEQPFAILPIGRPG